jgi:hypothetical protein
MAVSRFLRRLRGEEEQSTTQRALTGLALLRAANRLASQSKREEETFDAEVQPRAISEAEARSRTTLYIGSQALDTARYDPDSAALTLEFDNGQAYQFLGFPMTAWEAFLRSGSYGRHFNEQIRDRYTFRRMR